jgi:uncharacterized membrane protein YgcG
MTTKGEANNWGHADKRQIISYERFGHASNPAVKQKESDMKYLKISLLIFTILLPVIAVSADDKKSKSNPNESLYVVSARSGVVSIIDGDVTFKRGKSDWEPLIEGDELRSGDVVRTAETGRVEILLNPGTYLRVAENSEFAFPDLATFRLTLSLLKGAAILEASVIDVSIKFTTPEYMFTITRDGLYRFNTTADGRSEMMIRKGRVTVAGAEIKEGKKVVIEHAPPAIQAFDKKAEDDFDVWSKSRAKTIIASNKQLSNRRMKNSLGTGFMGNSWIYDPWSRSYTFLPGWGGFSSPYGFSYSNCNPYWYYSGGWGNGNGNGWGNGNSGGGFGSGGGSSSGSTGSVSSGTYNKGAGTTGVSSGGNSSGLGSTGIGRVQTNPNNN